MLDPEAVQNEVHKELQSDDSKRSGHEDSFHIRDTFTHARRYDSTSMQKVGIDKCSIYSEGPITKYIESVCRLPYESIPNSNNITVTKIA